MNQNTAGSHPPSTENRREISQHTQLWYTLITVIYNQCEQGGTWKHRASARQGTGGGGGAVKKVILEDAISELNPNTTQESLRWREKSRPRDPCGMLAGSSSWENLYPRNGQILQIRAFSFFSESAYAGVHLEVHNPEVEKVVCG